MVDHRCRGGDGHAHVHVNMSEFLRYHYRHRQDTATGAGSHRTAHDYYRNHDNTTDWSREWDTSGNTYLSMFGGVYHFCNDPTAEFRARELIASDLADDVRDYHGRPLALAECARRRPGGGGSATFPFFLDADICSATPRSAEEVVAFGSEVVARAIHACYPALDDTFRLIVCAASQPKDLGSWHCPHCDAMLPRQASSVCDACDKEVATDAAVHRPKWKTAVHYRTWNSEACRTGTCPLVVTATEAIAITSVIYAYAIGHPTYSSWGSPEAWQEWCDVAPVSSSVPSLRVLGTVKSSRCHACRGHKDHVASCILCGSSGKLVDNRPYGVVGCLDGRGAACTPPGDRAESLHATSIRVTSAVTTGFVPPSGSIRRLHAGPRDVLASMSLLRNHHASEKDRTFCGLSTREQRRLRALPVNSRKKVRPPASYRPIADPVIRMTVQAAVRNCPVFKGRYTQVILVSLFEQPRAPYRLVAHVDGFNSTFCCNRGPTSDGVVRGPGPHNSSRVYFMLDPDRGIRQRCFSEKPGACPSAATCRAWEGTPWCPLDTRQVTKIWPRQRARLYRGEDAVPATQGTWNRHKNNGGNQAAHARVLSHLIWDCIDGSRALEDLSQVDPRRLLEGCGLVARDCAGDVTHDRSVEMYDLLAMHGRAEPPRGGGDALAAYSDGGGRSEE